MRISASFKIQHLIWNTPSCVRRERERQSEREGVSRFRLPETPFPITRINERRLNSLLYAPFCFSALLHVLYRHRRRHRHRLRRPITIILVNVNISASSASAVAIRNWEPASACACAWANKQKTYMTYAPTPNCNYGGLPGSGPGPGSVGSGPGSVGPIGPQLHHPSSSSGATSVLMAPPSQGNIYTSMGHPAVSGAMTIGKHCARLLNYLLKPLPFGVALALAPAL